MLHRTGGADTLRRLEGNGHLVDAEHGLHNEQVGPGLGQCRNLLRVNFKQLVICHCPGRLERHAGRCEVACHERVAARRLARQRNELPVQKRNIVLAAAACKPAPVGAERRRIDDL